MALTIGVDIGGTKIAAGLVADDGSERASVRWDFAARHPEETVAQIADAIATLRVRADELGAGAVMAVGIGVAAFVDRGRRNIAFSVNLGWGDLALADLVAEAVGLPVVVENDANAASWGEFRFGAGRDHSDVVCVTVGTGIGGGIVIDGRLRRGAYGAAAEIGHVEVVDDGLPCGCGKRGCLEQYASGQALVRTARTLAAERRAEAATLLGMGDGTPEGVRGRDITAAARQGDPVAVEAFVRTGSWLGRGLATLATILDPEVFIVGGGVIDAGELLLAPAREAFREHLVAAGHRPLAPVLAAVLGNAAGLVGAGDLARS